MAQNQVTGYRILRDRTVQSLQIGLNNVLNEHLLANEIAFLKTNGSFANALLDTQKRKIAGLVKDTGVDYVAFPTTQSLDVTTQIGAISASTTAPTYDSGLRVWSNLGVIVYATADANKMVVRNDTGKDPVLNTSGAEVYGRITNKKQTAQPTNITGVTITYSAQESVAGNLIYTNAGQTLEWQGGPAVAVGAGGLFKLTGAVGYIVVSVSAGSLPGSDQTDAITFTSAYVVGLFTGSDVPYAFTGLTNIRIQATQWVAGSSTLLEDATATVNFTATSVDVSETNNINQIKSDLGITLNGTGAFSNPFGDARTFKTKIEDHISGSADKHGADDVTITGGQQTALGAASATVESALTALDDAIDAHLVDATDAHDASAISYVNTTSGLTAVNVQTAIDEVEGRVDTLETNFAAKAWYRERFVSPVGTSIVFTGTFILGDKSLHIYIDGQLQDIEIAYTEKVAGNGIDLTSALETNQILVARWYK